MHLCGGQRTTYKRWVSPSLRWVSPKNRAQVVRLGPNCLSPSPLRHSHRPKFNLCPHFANEETEDLRGTIHYLTQFI